MPAPGTLGAPLESVSPADFAYLQDFVRRTSAIVLEPGKEYLVESRLRPLAAQLGLAGIAGVTAAVRANERSATADHVIEAMTTNETSFFRDIHPFTALKEVVLPEVIERNAATRRLRIWCGASSSGQEPISIALTIRQHFPQLADWDVKVLCTDISPAMVARTASGCFSQLEVNRGLPAPMMVRWFKQQKTDWQAAPELLELLECRTLNLIGDWPPTMGTFDLVFLRNVLIYFDVADKSKVLKRLSTHLAPGGALFLGAAETTLGLVEGFSRRSHGSTSWNVKDGA